MNYLEKYGYTPDQEAISRALALIAANLENVASEQVYKDCFSMMDLTTLKTDDTPECCEGQDGCCDEGDCEDCPEVGAEECYEFEE